MIPTLILNSRVCTCKQSYGLVRFVGPDRLNGAVAVPFSKEDSSDSSG